MDPATLHLTGSTIKQDDLSALQAIAEPNRARIIELLGHGEHCGCDVGNALAMSPALVSHHLRVLRSAGLLRERRRGRWVFYALDLDRLAGLRSAVVGLITPTDAAAAECACSDCGPTKLNERIPEDLPRDLSVLAGSAR